ncbi:MAG: hypothetical protein A2521_15105 [Deltaproteobacteria bacterium RIFOXYD12_FULL_57_12]|nr:MAG: hypothetical protein A2521_15105 [Deltaproteobacteria bacterium RIFOXYD12_FULL_57_12]
MQLFQKATRNLFFTGKGGVGKTSLSCAAAITLADTGRRVLLPCFIHAADNSDVSFHKDCVKIPPTGGQVAS